MKTGHYVFVVGIVGAIIAGGLAFQQVSTGDNLAQTITEVDINSFEVLPEAEAHIGVSGTTGNYFNYATYSVSAGYWKTMGVRCNSGDIATGFMDFHKSTLKIDRNHPAFSFDSGKAYANGMYVYYHNTASYSNYVILYVFCETR